MRQAGSSGESQVVTWLCLGCGLPNSSEFLKIPPNSFKFLLCLAWP